MHPVRSARIAFSRISPTKPRERAMTSFYDLTAKTIDGSTKPLADYRDQVVLVVNVASQCGFTGQYRGLEALYRRYHDQGFTILGFPCDQFGHQEPGSEAEIASFCSRTYDVSFPLFAKVEVNGAGTHPLFKFLKRARRGFLGTQAVKWNFTKFLIDRRGNVVKRFATIVSPERLAKKIETALKSS